MAQVEKGSDQSFSRRGGGRVSNLRLTGAAASHDGHLRERSISCVLAAQPSHHTPYRPRPAGDGVTAGVPHEAKTPATPTTTFAAPQPPPEPATPAPPITEEATPAQSSASTYVVRRGDSLWRIALRQIAQVTGRPHDESAVRTYWLSMVEANLHRLRSGDPDLIYPGEELVLPPLPERQATR